MKGCRVRQAGLVGAVLGATLGFCHLAVIYRHGHSRLTPSASTDLHTISACWLLSNYLLCTFEPLQAPLSSVDFTLGSSSSSKSSYLEQFRSLRPRIGPCKSQSVQESFT